jgi:katanin p60 ATPase-containing subunit A1
MNNKSILDLPKYIKVARELSLYGSYKKSLELYKKIFRIIDSRLHEISTDNYLVTKWKDTKEQLKKECSLILSSFQYCRIFNSESLPQNLEPYQYQNENKNNYIYNDYRSPNVNIIREDPKRWAHFGGKAPFSYLKEKDNNDNNNIIQNYVVNKKIRNSEINYLNKFYKDPDVWASPEEDPRFSYDKKYNVPKRPPSYRNSNIDKIDLGVVNDKDIEKRRKNYDKPWQVPLYTKPKDPNMKNSNRNIGRGNNINDKKLKKQPPKSPFLMARYPEDNGNGPDTDLIEMVEREVVEMNPNVNFDDIAELESAKRALTEAVVLPLLMPDFFVGLRRPWKGVLLYGPPGTGKTLLAKALATQGKTTFFNVSPTTFASKWKGESEKLVRILFEMARFYAPSTIFIDEVDSIGTKRQDGENEANKKVLAEMLVQMDGISEINSDQNKNKKDDNNKNGEKKDINPKFVMVLGATNLPWDLDDALRRRFEKRIYISLPNKDGRKQMFNINFKGIKLDKSVKIDELVEKTKGYSGHDIASVCREASLMNMRRKILKGDEAFDLMEAANNETFIAGLEAPVTQSDILSAIKNISKSVSPKDIKKYEEWTKEYSSK